MVQPVNRLACLVLAGASIAAGFGCSTGSSTSAPTAAEAKTFLDTVNETLKKAGVEASQAG